MQQEYIELIRANAKDSASADQLIALFQQLHAPASQDQITAEQKRRNSLYHLLASNLPNSAIFLFDRNLRYTLAEGPNIAASGLSKQAFEGKTLSDIFPKEIADRDEPILRAALEGTTTVVEVTYGDQIFEVQTLPTRDEQGVIIGGMVLTQNITRLKQAEQFVEQISKTVPDVVYVYDIAQQCQIYANRETSTMLGYSPEEFAEFGVNPFKALIHPDDLQIYQHEARQIMSSENGEVVEAEYRFRHRNGEWRWLSVRKTVYKRQADGAPVQILGITRDITERKNVEQQRNQLLTEVELVNQDLKEFAYVVSHDLKAPLRGVSSIASWLASDYRDRFDEEGHRMLNLLIGRVQRMEQMINGVLEYSRIGHISETRIRVNLNQLLAEIIHDFSAVTYIHFTVETSLPTIIIEPTRIRQIFQNLIDNAVKFMDKPTGQISIGAESQDNGWLFWVKDNGPGIAPQYFTRIFQIFQTLTPRDQLESTGLGLAIIKRIVELYDGKIWVESTVGEGSTFYFTLPCPNIPKRQTGP